MKVIFAIFLFAITLSVSAQYVPPPGPNASETEKTIFQLNSKFMRYRHSTNKYLATFKKDSNLDLGELAFSVNAELSALEKLAEYSEDQIPEPYNIAINSRTPFLESMLLDYSEYFNKHSDRYERFKQ